MSKRRNLLALIGTVILLLSLSVPMMQCAPAAEEEVTPPSEEEGTKYGGRLNAGFRVVEAIEDLRCDSTWKYETMGCLFWQLPYNQLWVMGPPPEYDILPSLATSWDIEDGGKTWVFHLREDAVFHDGVPLTAEDVAFTWEYLRISDPAFSYSYGQTTISVIDDYTVQLTYEQAVAQPYYASYFEPILPKHIWEPYKDDMASFANEESIGSGAFKLKEFKPAQYVWFEANEDYWGGRPYVDEVVFKSYGSDDALYAALKTGEIDMMGYSGCSALAADDFRKTENIDVIVSPGVRIRWLSFNLYKEGPLQDLNVRKAIMHAIDRDKIIDLVFLGYGEKIDSFIYPELDEHNPNLPQYDYDVDKANTMLDDAGYVDTDGDGIRNDPATGQNLAFELHCASGRIEDVKAVTLIKEQLVDVGVVGEVKVSDFTTYASYLYAPTEGMYDIGLSGESPGPIADWMWEFTRSHDAGGEGWNTAYYNNPEMDELYTKLSAETDMTKRKEILYAMQMTIAEDVPYGFLWRGNMIDPVRTDKFEGFVLNMAGVSDWTNAFSYFNVHLK